MTACGFSLDDRLRADTRYLASVEAGELLLMDDARWPWLILVPRRPGASELHDLPDALYTTAALAWRRIGDSVQRSTGCTSVNVAALGNAVQQLHLHVVARSPGDPNWPRPVWGFEQRVPYPTDDLPAFAYEAVAALTDA